MKKLKHKKIHLAIVSILFSIPSMSSVAAGGFCGNSNEQVWNNNDPILTGELKSGQCYEVGAYEGSGDNNDSWAASAENLTLLDGSKLSVMGYINNSQVQSGAQLWITKTGLIYGDPYQPNIPALGSGIDVQSGGLVYVVSSGTLRDSFINGGRVNVTTNFSDKAKESGAGISINNEVNANGVLMVYSKGRSNNTIINSGGLETLMMDGASDGTLINAGGSQYVLDDSKAVNTIINGGTQTLYLGTEGKTPGIAEHTVIQNGGLQVVQNGAQAFDTTLWDSGRQNIRAGSTTTNTTLNDSSITLLQAGAQALGDTVVNNQAQLQLVTGSLNKSTEDPGAYAERVLLQDAESSLKIRASKDSGSAFVNELDGRGQVIFDPGTENQHSHLVIGTLSGNQTFWMNTSIAERKNDSLTITQSSGEHALRIRDSGAEITQPTENDLDLVNDLSGNGVFTLAAVDGTNINAVDGGTYMYTLQQREEGQNKVWYLSSELQPVDPIQPDIVAPSERTTPSTDAVLSMASANQFIFDSELQSLRHRKGDLNGSKGQNAGAWGRYLTHNSNIHSADGVAYKMQQNGLEIGGDKVFSLTSGSLIAGAFTSYTDNNIKLARGGNGKIGSYSLGAYLTYFDNAGYYLDGVIKVNRFNNTLNARMTSGETARGSYHQNAIGGALEAGYHYNLIHSWFAEPYLRMSYFIAESKGIALSNGMVADINKSRSAKAEVGSALGTRFSLQNGLEIKPYIRIALEQEFIKSNTVTINQRNDFDNDFSGSSSKYGLGTDILVTPNTSIYAEANYRKGQYIESPIIGNVGFRINF
ncbi:autotransporter outer membrane beta-barrel domain-containing protein [Leminorella grimontii]|uniref:autotransporter outer membrane beta-barrel domain-containing protein n=1 Tax=Leminorella grimontii TaxID=82981 RepID=UPI00208D388F|nr:autotransporter outer membrane beta-barrel domain-containing protein [Leminorella grimontii]GKX59689.1 autotransporter [Leminorella grimontii]